MNQEQRRISIWLGYRIYGQNRLLIGTEIAWVYNTVLLAKYIECLGRVYIEKRGTWKDNTRDRSQIKYPRSKCSSQLIIDLNIQSLVFVVPSPEAHQGNDHPCCSQRSLCCHSICIHSSQIWDSYIQAIPDPRHIKGLLSSCSSLTLLKDDFHYLFLKHSVLTSCDCSTP